MIISFPWYQKTYSGACVLSFSTHTSLRELPTLTYFSGPPSTSDVASGGGDKGESAEDWLGRRSAWEGQSGVKSGERDKIGGAFKVLPAPLLWPRAAWEKGENEKLKKSIIFYQGKVRKCTRKGKGGRKEEWER